MADGPAPVADAPPPAADAAVPVVDASPGDPAAEAALNPINAAFGCPSDPALLACYTFDEGPATSILDGSGLGHHGTTNAPRTAGVHGMALKFADDKSVAQVRSTPALTLAGSNATIEAWVRPTMFPAENQLDHLLVKMNAAHDRGYAFGVSKGRFGGYNASSGQLAGSLPLHTWSHIAVVWSAGGLSLYQDGVRVGSFGRLDLTPSDDPLFVGNINPANAELSASYTAYFGDLDVLRIYARPRTPEEICADANRSFRTGGCF